MTTGLQPSSPTAGSSVQARTSTPLQRWPSHSPPSPQRHPHTHHTASSSKHQRPSRRAAQVTGPSVKATPGLVQLLADTLASGTGLPPSAVTPGKALNNSRCFDSPPPVTTAGRRLHAALPGLLSQGQLAQAALQGLQEETQAALEGLQEETQAALEGGEGEVAVGGEVGHSLRRLQQGCLTTVLVEMDVDATSHPELDYRNQARPAHWRVLQRRSCPAATPSAAPLHPLSLEACTLVAAWAHLAACAWQPSGELGHRGPGKLGSRLQSQCSCHVAVTCVVEPTFPSACSSLDMALVLQTQEYITSGQYQKQVAAQAPYVEDIELAEFQDSHSPPIDFDTAGAAGLAGSSSVCKHPRQQDLLHALQDCTSAAAEGRWLGCACR